VYNIWLGASFSSDYSANWFWLVFVVVNKNTWFWWLTGSNIPQLRATTGFELEPP